MKKFLAGLAVLVLLAGLGAAVWLLLQMEEDPAQTVSSAPQAGTRTELNVRQKARDYAEMLEALDYETRQNRDTVGWLKIPGTEVNNSVLQSFDNAYYLRRDERRNDELYGCYFVDYECSVGGRELLEANTVIYGHSDMKDNAEGRRFSQLFHFLDPAFAAATPCIQFCTPDEPMEWQIFAVFYTDVEFNYIQVLMDGPQRVALAQAAMERSIYDYGVTVGEEDKLLTLSTCTARFGDSSHRFVVMAKLLGAQEEPPETAAVVDRPENR